MSNEQKSRDGSKLEYRVQNLGEATWQDFMKTDPAFRVGDIFVFRSKGADYDGYTVAIYEIFDDQTGGADINQYGIFWSHVWAMAFANLLKEQKS